uniref:Uncharacterized protein n=1 Tax=Hemiselmis andersenii TaxID=464988 RepID=A0A6U5BZY0_HEMAN|mmetsp:Transcript_18422/g.42671  ORF Transcript_18422/g.42671 Transcript_18422/m.42671 type:complete len:620 (+) Transcript_18422:24-1883(+)|eukprot:CAMPEP_0169471736 /NCGR_PEP_ID=MMETSP1042-20121227/24762_1 /TAXON_ID=464988 /ORGANISM="Hemiselmis andersenii, Strain CCMP1180" /LENGTH=619 /DNA_ID=CAMNT_0009585479 /DNA_START=24 /DNA_END=1883 /DNA_ORIENTATION=-
MVSVAPLLGGGRTRRSPRVTALVAAVAVVGMVALVASSLSSRGGSRRVELVSKPAGDFTAQQDKEAFGSYFSKLSQAEASEHAKYLAKDHKAEGAAGKQLLNIAKYFVDMAEAVVPSPKGSQKAAKPAAAMPVHHHSSKAPADDSKVAAAAYQSGDDARNDIASFFDSMKTGKAKGAKHLTAKDAEKQLDSIFPTNERAVRSHEEKQEAKEAQKALSARAAQSEMDSYFDSMAPTTHHAARHHAAAPLDDGLGEPAHKRWASQSSDVRDYIESKRNAIKSQGGFTDVTSDGHFVKQKERWSSENSRKEMDGYWNSLSGATRAQEDRTARKNNDVKAYERLHPMYKKAVEMAQKDWMKTHRGPPTNKAEAMEYNKLIESENPRKDEQSHIVMKAYLKQHPEVAAKFKKVHDDWYAKHSKPPSTPQEQSEYAALTAKVVGHLDIDSKAVLAKARAEAPSHGEEKHTGSKADLLREYLQSHPHVQANIDRVHSEWKRHHSAPPSTPAEKRAYDGLMKRYVGDLHITSAKKGVPLTTLAKVDAATAKANAMDDYLSRHKALAQKVQKVHRLWRNKHTAPPQTPAEEKEYDALMSKYVGHPDVNELYDTPKKDDFGDMDASLLS